MSYFSKDTYYAFRKDNEKKFIRYNSTNVPEYYKAIAKKLTDLIRHGFKVVDVSHGKPTKIEVAGKIYEASEFTDGKWDVFFGEPERKYFYILTENAYNRMQEINKDDNQSDKDDLERVRELINVFCLHKDGINISVVGNHADIHSIEEMKNFLESCIPHLDKSIEHGIEYWNTKLIDVQKNIDNLNRMKENLKTVK